jgi:hypothetical protein
MTMKMKVIEKLEERHDISKYGLYYMLLASLKSPN